MAFISQLLLLFLDPVTLALLITAAALTVFMNKDTKVAWPKGPPTIPILGNVPQLLVTKNLSMVEFMEDSRKKYGNVYTVEFGGIKRVILSGYDNMRELLVTQADHTSSRTAQALPKNQAEFSTNTPGLIFADYPHWKTIRSFALNILRSEGMGKASLEPTILHEVHCYIDHFVTPNLGRSIKLVDSMMLATANITGVMILSNRREYGDVQFVQWVNAFRDSVHAAIRAAAARNIPGVAYMPGDLTGVKSDLRASELVTPQIMGSVNEHRATIDMKHPRDFIDRFLIHGIKEENKGNCSHVFTDGNAGATTMHLYATGAETTSTALQWALLFMCYKPEVQQRLQQEIDNTIGERDVEYKDRLILPYTSVVIMEILRLGNIAPTALPHTMQKDIEIEGVIIPAGAEVTLNMASVLWDEEVYENPREFNPDRFLEGDVKLKKERFMPFGLGRRSCLGKGLAKMELMLFFTTFMQKFKVSSPHGQKLSLDGYCSLVNAPMAFDIIFERR